MLEQRSSGNEIQSDGTVPEARGGWNWSREIVNKLARYAFQACDHEVGASVSSSSLAVVALLHPD